MPLPWSSTLAWRPITNCVGCARVDKDVCERRPETIKVVRDKRVVPRYSPVLIKHSQRSIGMSSNPVVQHRVTVSEAPDFNSRAIRAEDGALRTRHGYNVVYDDCARFRRQRRWLANHIDACGRCVGPTAIDRIMRNEI